MSSNDPPHRRRAPGSSKSGGDLGQHARARDYSPQQNNAVNKPSRGHKSSKKIPHYMLETVASKNKARSFAYIHLRARSPFSRPPNPTTLTKRETRASPSRAERKAPPRTYHTTAVPRKVTQETLLEPSQHNFVTRKSRTVEDVPRYNHVRQVKKVASSFMRPSVKIPDERNWKNLEPTVIPLGPSFPKRDIFPEVASPMKQSKWVAQQSPYRIREGSSGMETLRNGQFDQQGMLTLKGTRFGQQRVSPPRDPKSYLSKPPTKLYTKIANRNKERHRNELGHSPDEDKDQRWRKPKSHLNYQTQITPSIPMMNPNDVNVNNDLSKRKSDFRNSAQDIEQLSDSEIEEFQDFVQPNRIAGNLRRMAVLNCCKDFAAKESHDDMPHAINLALMQQREEGRGNENIKEMFPHGNNDETEIAEFEMDQNILVSPVKATRTSSALSRKSMNSPHSTRSKTTSRTKESSSGDGWDKIDAETLYPQSFMYHEDTAPTGIFYTADESKSVGAIPYMQRVTHSKPALKEKSAKLPQYNLVASKTNRADKTGAKRQDVEVPDRKTGAIPKRRLDVVKPSTKLISAKGTKPEIIKQPTQKSSTINHTSRRVLPPEKEKVGIAKETTQKPKKQAMKSTLATARAKSTKTHLSQKVEPSSGKPDTTKNVKKPVPTARGLSVPSHIVKPQLLRAPKNRQALSSSTSAVQPKKKKKKKKKQKKDTGEKKKKRRRRKVGRLSMPFVEQGVRSRADVFIEQFALYSKYSDRRNSGRSISLSNTIRWMKKAGIIRPRVATIHDVEILFIHKAQKLRSLTITAFLQFLQLLATEKNLNISKIVEALMDCGEPVLSTTDITINEVLARESPNQPNKFHFTPTDSALGKLPYKSSAIAQELKKNFKSENKPQTVRRVSHPIPATAYQARETSRKIQLPKSRSEDSVIKTPKKAKKLKNPGHTHDQLPRNVSSRPKPLLKIQGEGGNIGRPSRESVKNPDPEVGVGNIEKNFESSNESDMLEFYRKNFRIPDVETTERLPLFLASPESLGYNVNSGPRMGKPAAASRNVKFLDPMQLYGIPIVEPPVVENLADIFDVDQNSTDKLEKNTKRKELENFVETLVQSFPTDSSDSS